MWGRFQFGTEVRLNGAYYTVVQHVRGDYYLVTLLGASLPAQTYLALIPKERKASVADLVPALC